jgi:hypothetical protein
MNLPIMVWILVYTTHLLVKGAVERARRGVTLSMKKQNLAKDMQGFCNVFARVLKRLCHKILQCICNSFAMQSPGLRKEIARVL